MSQVDTIIQKAKSLLGSHAYDDYCQRFVRVCYEAAGIYGTAASATEACNKWKVSSGKTNIPVGAAVYYSNNNSNGHAAIYLGDNKIIHAWQGVQITSIDVPKGYKGWGWQGGKKPSGATSGTSNVSTSGTATSSKTTKKSLGVFTLTAYCPCVICCGKSDGITASGVKATPNHTIAVDTSVIAMGSLVEIRGKTYKAEDTGGAIKGKRIDIFFKTHQEALDFGIQQAEVFVVTKTSETSETSEKKELSSTKIVSITGSDGLKKSLFNPENPAAGYYELYINNSGKVYQPIVQDGVQWDTERTGSPSKLTFTVLKDSYIAFDEGDAVQFKVNGDGVFYGYVFSKTRDKEHHIKVIAYDQLRYLKNKETYIFTNKRADQILQMIADDFKLTVGKLANTGYVIPTRIEDNSTLFDIIANAIDLTYSNTGKRYLLYDDFGSIQLQDIANFKFNLMINNETAENFDYQSSIDDETYNKIVLYKDTDEGVREKYVFQSGDNISQWGVLQYTDTFDEGESPSIKGKQLLTNYNKVTRKLSVKGCLGDARIRAGSQVFVSLNIGDLILYTYMMVESASHTFENDHYTMDLQLVKIGSFTA